MDWVLSHHQSGHVGFKLMLNANARVLEHLQQREVPVIHVRRENALARFSSSVIAGETGRRVVLREAGGHQRQSSAGQTAQRVKVRFDADLFQEHWLWCKGMEKRLCGARNILVTEYNDIGSSDWSDRVCRYLGVAPRCLSASTIKLNSSDILSRFSNPEEVEKYLASIGRLDWVEEGTRSIR